MLSDIVAAGEAARLQLEQTRGLTQDFTLMNSRVSTLDDRMTSLLKGIVYLISLRWVFSNSRLSLGRDVSGSEVVNEVMSNERPFSFANENVGLLEAAEVATQVVVETTDVATQAYVEATENTVVEGTSISTQTENTDVDQIYSIISPAIQAHGVTRVLLRLRQVITVITESILSSDEEEEYSADTPRSTDSVDTLEDVPTLEYRNETSSVEYTERSPETPERSPVTRSPETPGRAGALSRLCNPA